jgi:hypothetical protein
LTNNPKYEIAVKEKKLLGKENKYVVSSSASFPKQKLTIAYLVCKQALDLG